MLFAANYSQDIERYTALTGATRRGGCFANAAVRTINFNPRKKYIYYYIHQSIKYF